VQARMRPRML